MVLIYNLYVCLGSLLKNRGLFCVCLYLFGGLAACGGPGSWSQEAAKGSRGTRRGISCGAKLRFLSLFYSFFKMHLMAFSEVWGKNFAQVGDGKRLLHKCSFFFGSLLKVPFAFC